MVKMYITYQDDVELASNYDTISFTLSNVFYSVYGRFKQVRYWILLNYYLKNFDPTYYINRVYIDFDKDGKIKDFESQRTMLDDSEDFYNPKIGYGYYELDSPYYQSLEVYQQQGKSIVDLDGLGKRNISKLVKSKPQAKKHIMRPSASDRK